MRQRKVKDLDEKLRQYREFTVEEPEKTKGRWKEIFGNKNEILLELGCGKGQFITKLAEENPDKNFIAVEGQRTVLLRAFEKVRDKDLKNIRFIASYVQNIADYFEKGELSGIYLNFSDPWPKERHGKRRLTHLRYLESYRKVLKDGGMVEFKTDNDGLYRFSIEEILRGNFEILEETEDLHNSSFESKNNTTEYEDKFRSMGKNINYVKFRV